MWIQKTEVTGDANGWPHESPLMGKVPKVGMFVKWLVEKAVRLGVL